SGDNSDAGPLLPKANTRRWIDNQFGRVLRFQFGIPNLDCFVNRSLHSILHSSTVPENIKFFLGNLEVKGIEFCETDGRSAPAEAAMHNRGTIVPKFVISPKSEYGVSQTLMLLKNFDLYKKIAVSIKNGGHGYSSGGSQPDLLYAMRGGAAAAIGVVTRIRLRLIDEPPSVTWCFAPIDKTQLQLYVAKKAFANARGLPRAITKDPVCSFNITSLLSAKKITEFLRRYLGPELVELVADSSL
ncbi:hypothetical protein PoMZ_13576, partial [Pyricularia oryzae]